MSEVPQALAANDTQARVEDCNQHDFSHVEQILSSRHLTLKLSSPERSLNIGTSGKNPDVEFVFSSDHKMRSLFRCARLLKIAEGYINGTFDVVGPLDRAIEILDEINLAVDQKRSLFESMLGVLHNLCKSRIPVYARSFESAAHYDMSTAVYKAFLDSNMQYTCGLFRSGRESLEDSQIAKFELIKRLIAPKDESLNSLNHLDIGCGWGGLIEFFTTNYGTNSIGVTNSRRQYEYNKKQGRGGRVVFGDFLELKNADKRFDVITVVGMIEHLPTARRDELFALMRNILSPSGKIYLQCIARPSCWIGGDAYRLAQKHVFPGHFLQSRDETNDLISRHGFVVEWSEDHAAHYGHTTAHWIRNIAQSKRLICDEIGERNYRLFHGYLGYASRLFLTGRGSLLRYAISVV